MHGSTGCRLGVVVALSGFAAVLTASAPALAQEEEAPAEAIEETPPDPESWTQGWTGSVAIGLNGSSGNTETLSFRGEVTATRETSKYVTSGGLLYAYATRDGEETENRFDANARNDWKFKDSPWRFFALGQFTADEFQDWDYRVSAFAGPGYVFLESDRTFLLGRVGAGGSKEFGGADEDVTPEGLLGLDFKHKLTDRQSVFATAEFYPALDELKQYRAMAKAGWEVLVDPEVNLSLKVGVEDRYDSNPGEGFKRNDISYFALLSWSF